MSRQWLARLTRGFSCDLIRLDGWIARTVNEALIIVVFWVALAADNTVCHMLGSGLSMERGIKV
jgi:hypothetical protein